MGVLPLTQWLDGYGVRIADIDASGGFSTSGQVVEPSLEDDLFARLRASLALSQEVAMNELVQIAVTYCHADSAGISLEEEGPTGELQFRWVVVAGSFVPYLNGTTPRFYSPCGTCLDRGVPQRYQIWEPYYNFLGVKAQPIRDGLLIPWRGEHRQGTLWIVSHQSNDSFTESDFQLVRKLAAFVSAHVPDLPKLDSLNTNS